MFTASCDGHRTYSAQLRATTSAFMHQLKMFKERKSLLGIIVRREATTWTRRLKQLGSAGLVPWMSVTHVLLILLLASVPDIP